jgi:molybdopterin adenylyltransferase
MTQPHPDLDFESIVCAVITLSDTRTEETDRSGQVTQTMLTLAGHRVGHYEILPDDPDRLRHQLGLLAERSDLDVFLLNGGTGIAPRDRTYETIEALIELPLPGFGELFRMLSYNEIGARAMASRAVAGIYAGKPLFSMPGSSSAVRLALDALILPELQHLVRQVQGRS